MSTQTHPSYAAWRTRTLLAAALLAALLFPLSQAMAQVTQPSSPSLTKWLDDLPIPQTFAPISQANGADYYEICMGEGQQYVHKDFEPGGPFGDRLTTIWGYGTYNSVTGRCEASWPARTIEATKDRLVRVKWTDMIWSPSGQHMFYVPPESKVSMNGAFLPDLRTIVHLHGANVSSNSDIYPGDWMTYGDSRTTDYPNRQPGATLWFHDHAVNITRLNVMAGLAGMYILRDPADAGLNLPAPPYDIPLVLQDRVFDFNGNIWYPQDLMPEFFGDVSVVNGKAWPKLAVEPRKYLFRVLNGSNSRFYNMHLVEYDPVAKLAKQPLVDGPPINMVASDGGKLAAPRFVSGAGHASVNYPGKLFRLGPGERAEVVVDFTNPAYAGKQYVLYNDASFPFDGTFLADPYAFDPLAPDLPPLPELMLFDVAAPLAGPDSSIVKSTLADLPPPNPAQARRTRYIELAEQIMPSGKHYLTLNGRGFEDQLTDRPVRNSYEIWELYNGTNDVHPIHLHMVHFQLLDRRPILYQRNPDGTLVLDANLSPIPVLDGQGRFQADPNPPTPLAAIVPPDPDEAGWKDTIVSTPGEVTRFIAHFGDFAGLYVFHCHILEHEDHSMMRPMGVYTPMDGAYKNLIMH